MLNACCCKRVLKVQNGSMCETRREDLPMLARRGRSHQRAIATCLRPLTPASREVATAAAAAAWPNSTFWALHTTALALHNAEKGIYCQAERRAEGDCANAKSRKYVCLSVITWRHEPHGRWQQRWQCALRVPFRLVLMRRGEIKLLLCKWVCEQDCSLPL